MLLIREDQLRMFRGRARARFEGEIARHFLATYPFECAEAGGEAAVLDLVRRGVERAGERGYFTQYQAGLYIGLTFMLGSDFENDPQIPWAAEELGDVTIADPTTRILRLYGAAMDYLGATAGAGCRHLSRALAMIRRFDLRTVADLKGPSWEGDLRRRFRHFYPEKHDFQGEEATGNLARLAGTVAGRHGLSGNRGVTVVGTLMFLMGSGFDADPLYPWAARGLADPALAADPAALEGFLREAVAHLEGALPSGGEDRP